MKIAKLYGAALRIFQNVLYWEKDENDQGLSLDEGDHTMEQAKIDRINELARKAKAEGLTPEEEAERATLRAEYIAAYRASLRGQLENLRITTPDGQTRPLRKKDDDTLPQ